MSNDGKSTQPQAPVPGTLKKVPPARRPRAAKKPQVNGTHVLNGSGPALPDQTEFLALLAKGRPKGSHFLVAPRTERGTFPAQTWREQHLDGPWYFNTGASSHRRLRTKERMTAVRAIILDDINADGVGKGGGKVLAEPTWKLETSTGNFQWGYLLTEWSAEIDKADALFKALIEAGLQDQGVDTACRLFRMPGSINTKEGRNNFESVLHTFDRTRTFTLNTLAKKLKVKPSLPEKAEPQGSRPAPTSDRIFDWLEASGNLGEYKGAGCWFIECPWPEEHSDERTDAWVMAATAPESKNHCFNVSCFHGHAQGDKASEYRKRFLSWVVEQGGPSEDEERRASFDAMHAIAKAMHAAGHQPLFDGWGFEAKTIPQMPVAAPDREKWDFTDRTDSGNTALLKTLTDGGMRYVPELKLWIFWTGTQWVRDDHGTHFETVMLQMAKMYVDQGAAALAAAAQIAVKEDRDKAIKEAAKIAAWGQQCRDRKRLSAMREQAKVYPGLPISAAVLDTHRHLLGVANGVVDLRTGELRDDARDDFITLRSPYAYKPEATAPRWMQFIREVSGLQDGTRRAGLEKYHQIRAGYAFSGEVKEQKFFNDFGRGSNGKNIMLDQYAHTLGPYSYEMPAGSFVKSYNTRDANAPSPVMHGLMHKRFAVASEWEKGKQVDMPLLLRVTGNETLTTRDLHGKNVTTPITAKVFFPSNDALETGGGVSEALKGRAHVVPFSKKWNRPDEVDGDPTLPVGDKNLKATLRGESEGILAWAVQGAVLYYRQGLTLPGEVADATRSYVKKQNPFAEWFGTVTPLEDDFDRTNAPNFDTVYGHYVEHCRASGAGPANERTFSGLLAGKAVPKAEYGQGKGRTRYGILLHKKEASTGRSGTRRPS